MASDYSFTIEHTSSIPEKGVLVTGICQGGPPQTGDRVRFESAGGETKELRVVGVVRKVTDDRGRALEGRTGLILDGTEPKVLRAPLVLSGHKTKAE